MAIGPEQRKALNRAKLLSLVRSHFSDLDVDADAASSTGFDGGAVAIVGDRAIGMIEGDAVMGRLGHLLLSVGPGPQTIDVLVDGEGADVLARRATGFDRVRSVSSIDGDELVAVAAPKPNPPVADLPHDDPLVEVMRDEGLEVVIEDGIILGEHLGVEVARIVDGHDGVPRLDVGVGIYDQDAFALINAGLSPDDGLAKVCEIVRELRHAGAEPHPLNRLAQQRWLRALALADPGSIGMARLTTVPTILRRDGIRDTKPAVAVGTDADGAMVGVVCSVGVDFDMVPTAADLVWQYGLERVVLMLPERDNYPMTRDLADQMNVPVQIISVTDTPWP